MPNRWNELGAKRIAISKDAKSLEDWKKLWFEPEHGYPFEYGECWNFVTEYRVVDFEAEVGFFTDGLCLFSYVLSEDYAMFTDEKRTLFMSFVPAGEEPTTQGFSLQFMVKDIATTVSELTKRGIEPVQGVHNPYPGGPMRKAIFETPNGIPIHLWGMVDEA